MNISQHIFFHVVKRPKDFFKGFRKLLSDHNAQYTDVILEDKYYEIVDNAEYAKVFLYTAASELKIIRRAINYRKVFLQFENRASEIINGNPANTIYYFYLADEGVWGEFIKKMRAKLEKKYSIKILIINIQHGFFTFEDIKLSLLRKLVNKLFDSLLGFPILGFGFGGGKLDTYFVYGSLEKRYLEKRTPNSRIIVSPSVCKYELIEEVRSYQKKQTKLKFDKRKSILFAAQLNEINPDCFYDEEEITQKIAPLFFSLYHKGYKVYYRLHPAIPDKERYINLLSKYEILDKISLANEYPLSYYLSQVGSVMALQSTTLYDGFVVGRMPIIVKGLNKEFEFTTKHETINLFDNIDTEIDKAFDCIDDYFKEQLSFDFEKDVQEYFKKIV